MATLADCVSEVRLRTDTVGSLHVTDAEIRLYLNKELAALYGRLTSVFEDYNVTTAQVVVTNASLKGFSLPADFFKLLRLDRSLSGNVSVNDWYRMRRINIRDEANFNFPGTVTMGFPRVYGYVMYGSEVHIVPQTMVRGAYQYLYYPCWTVLASSDTVAIGPAGQQWEQYAILRACVTVANKEETDPAGFLSELAAMDARLEGEMTNRDASEAEPPPETQVPWYEKGDMGRGNWAL